MLDSLCRKFARNQEIVLQEEQGRVRGSSGTLHVFCYKQKSIETLFISKQPESSCFMKRDGSGWEALMVGVAKGCVLDYFVQLGDVDHPLPQAVRTGLEPFLRWQTLPAEKFVRQYFFKEDISYIGVLKMLEAFYPR